MIKYSTIMLLMYENYHVSSLNLKGFINVNFIQIERLIEFGRFEL